jgi:WD40 repeat protein
MNQHPRIRVDPSGKLLTVDTSFIPSTDDYATRTPLAAAAVPAEIMQGINVTAPGIKLSRVFRVTTKGSTDPNYEAYGKVDRTRGVEIHLGGNGHVFSVATTIPLKSVPKAVADAIAREAREEKRLVGFRPYEARLLHLPGLGLNGGEDQYQLFGDDPEGNPLDVRVDGQGKVNSLGDGAEYIREEAGIAAPKPRRQEPTVAATGFSVLAARFGIDHNWIDITEKVRSAATAGQAEFKPDGLPDPAYGRHKSIVMMYSEDGKVGLSEVRDDEPLPLDARQDSSTLAPVPAKGFAVLSAHFGFEEKWEDVTEAVRKHVKDDRLDFKPTQAGLPDLAPDQPKALTVAYAIDGKVGYYVQSQWRSPNLPNDAPPVNSGTLLARSIEYPRSVSLVTFTPNGKQVIAGVEDGSIRILDAATGREAHRLDAHGPGWVSVSVSGNGSLIASGGADKTVRIWDVKTEREKAVMRGHTEPVHHVALSPNGRTVVSASWDKTVRVWDAANGRELRQLTGHGDTAFGLKFTPDGKQIVTASWDRSVRIWDVATGREVNKYQTNGDNLGDVAISKTGRDIFFGAKDGFLRWWQPATKQEPSSFNTDSECEWAIAVFPDGHRVLVGDKVAAVIWDCKTKHPILRLEEHIGRVTGVALSPNGRLAATCSEDKTLKLWNLPDLGK